jgi:hypothetical protein
MGKDLIVSGSGSSSPSGKKRSSAGGDDEAVVVDEEPNCQLSLGAIYGGAAATSPPKVDGESGITAAQAQPVPRHSAVAAAVKAQAPVPAALFAAKAEIAPLLLNGANGIHDLNLVPRQSAVAAPAVNLEAQAPIPAAGAAFVAAGTSPAPPPPRASPAARPAQRSVRRRIANGSPPQPATVAGGDPPAPPTSGTAPPLPIASQAPFPWATNRVAIHHAIAHLSALGITTVEGEVHCSRCTTRKTVSYDIAAKFQEVRDFVCRNVHDMDDRAPEAWLNPKSRLLDCDGCGQRSSVRPVIPADKERINWVFLLLGQTLGLCTLEQLKYFCARTRQHRTGAKDRVLYSTYMELCNQLCPDRLFNLTAERQNRGQQYS